MRWMALFFAVMMMAIGCDGGPVPIQTAPVSGTVTYQGKPLAGYTVYFYVPGTAAQVPAIGKVGPEGKFTLSVREEGGGAIVGLNQVWLEFIPEMPEVDTTGAFTKVPFPEPDVKIPEKYTSRDTSSLTVEVPPEGLDNYELKLAVPSNES